MLWEKEKPQILIIYVVGVFVVNHESLSWKTKVNWKRLFILFMLDINSKINSFYLFLISMETDYFLLFVILNIFLSQLEKVGCFSECHKIWKRILRFSILFSWRKIFEFIILICHLCMLNYFFYIHQFTLWR